jgi:hypothetical protein
MFPRKTKTNRLPEVRRLPGQSLRDEKERLSDDHLVPVVWIPILFWVVCGVESVHAWLKAPLLPWFWLFAALAATGFSWIGFRQLIPKFQRLNRGERGELRVAEELDDLRSYGYRVTHDLTCDGFNIDHVAVGPAGVFAIETKFRSGKGDITFRNGEGLFIDGRPEEKDSLNQAVANAAEVRRMLKEDCKVHEWVSAVLVFVGDWKIRNKWQTTNARVVTADNLVTYIVDQQPRLTSREIELIASHLERSAKN